MPNKAAGGIKMQLRWELSVLVSGIQNRGLFSGRAVSVFTSKFHPTYRTCARRQPSLPRQHSARPQASRVPHGAAAASPAR